jgi:glucose/arabinose dehydrogenase
MPRSVALIVALVLALAALPIHLVPTRAQQATPAAGPPPFPPPSANVSVFAEGLDNPRGLEFGPDGMLYVAEGGQGGTVSTEGQCEQVVPPVGPYTGGENNARISALDAEGQRTSVAEGIPSTQTAGTMGSLVSGVADVAFVDETLYYLLASGGCSHGNPDVPNGVFRVTEDGTTELVADLSAFVQANPVAAPNRADFEPDESAYGLEAFNGQLYVTESNHGALDRVDPDGTVERVIDFSATEGHIVPTGIAAGPDGNLYVSNLTPLPFLDGAAVVYQVAPDGQFAVHTGGVTAVLGLAFDGEGRLYVLETSTGNLQQPPFFVPGSGRVVRLTDAGELEVVATGLVFPTGIAFGPDGNLYVSNFGFGFPPGAGQVVKIDLSAPLPDTAAVRAPAATPGMGTPAP